MQDKELKQESSELKNNMFPIHLYIMDKVPSYGYGEPKSSMRKIKECLRKMEYDEEFIENINEDFCQGFGTARDIIFELLKNKYWGKD